MLQKEIRIDGYREDIDRWADKWLTKYNKMLMIEPRCGILVLIQN